jgi:hypothetical protein
MIPSSPYPGPSPARDPSSPYPCPCPYHDPGPDPSPSPSTGCDCDSAASPCRQAERIKLEPAQKGGANQPLPSRAQAHVEGQVWCSGRKRPRIRRRRTIVGYTGASHDSNHVIPPGKPPYEPLTCRGPSRDRDPPSGTDHHHTHRPSAPCWSLPANLQRSSQEQTWRVRPGRGGLWGLQDRPSNTSIAD